MSAQASADVRLRPLTPDDLDAAVELLVESRLCERAGLTARLRFLLQNAPHWCLAALCHGRLVGVLLASYNGFHVFLSHIAIARIYQRQGIGALLHAELVRRAQDGGAHGVITDARLSAVSFFYSLGYRLPGAVFLVRDLH